MAEAHLDADAIRRLHARAVEEYNSGRPVEARATLRHAIAMLANSTSLTAIQRDQLAARIWISTAVNEAELRSPEAGLTALRTAETLARRAGDRIASALIQAQRGAIALRLERPAEALRSFEALSRNLTLLSSEDRATALSNQGIALMLLGDLRRARTYFDRAIAVARSAELPAAHFRARSNLAYLDYLTGELPQALAGFDEAANLGVTGSEGRTGLAVARILIEAGLYRRADEALERAAAVSRSNRVYRDVAELTLERAGVALIIGDVPAARRLAARARDIFRRRKNDMWRQAALTLLQADLAAGRPGSRLVGPAKELCRSFAADGLRIPARAAALVAAEAALVSGNSTDAAKTIAGAPSGRRTDPIGLRLHAGYVEAKVADGDGDSATARRVVRRGLAQVAKHQARLGSLDLQTASAIHGRRLAAFDLQLALRDGRATSVFAAAERARAVSTRLAPVRPPKDPVTARLYADLRQAVDALADVGADPAAVETQIRRRAEIERRISARSWTLPGSGQAHRVAGLDEVRAMTARSATTMIVYIEVAGDLAAVVVDDHQVRLHRLGAAAPVVEAVRRLRADMDVAANGQLPEGVRAAVHASMARMTEYLDATIVRPLGRRERLVVISTGTLGQVPWGALPTLRGVPVAVAPSATTWLAAMAHDRRRNAAIVAASGPGLVRGAAEVQGIGGLWIESSPVVRAAADRHFVRSAMATARILHVAAHGVHQTENPLFSTLRLDDGVLFAHELDQARRTPQHVVLSACEVGLSTVRPGDEALGFTSVLLRLGTRSVVAGVARVNDAIAAEAMVAYHERLAAGADSAAALAAAVEAADGIAPFVCFGSTWTARGDASLAISPRRRASKP